MVDTAANPDTAYTARDAPGTTRHDIHGMIPIFDTGTVDLTR